MSNHSSYLFREISFETAKQLLGYGGISSELKELKLLRGGLFNTTYFLRCENGQRLILRLGPVNRERLLEFERYLMKAEEAIYQTMQKAGIPTSKLLFYDGSCEKIDREYQIVEYIETEKNDELTEQEKAAVEYEAGRYTKIMHNITSKCFGTFYQVQQGKGFPDWYSFLRDYLEQILNQGRKWKVFSEQECIQAQRTLEQNQTLLTIAQASFLHADLWSGNLLVKDKKLCAIIDADRAIWGDPDYEFASGWMGSNAFFEGYGVQAKKFEEPENKKKRLLYQMIYALMETYIWSIEYDEPEQSDAARNRLKEIMKELENSKI